MLLETLLSVESSLKFEISLILVDIISIVLVYMIDLPLNFSHLMSDVLSVRASILKQNSLHHDGLDHSGYVVRRVNAAVVIIFL